MDFLRKKMSHAFDTRAPLEGISTGSVAVDFITGDQRGFPRGCISEVFGLESSGKSTLCMSCVAKAQADGLYAVYVDVERSLLPDHATKLGFNVNVPGCWLRPRTFEETLTIIDTMAQQGRADIVLVDSVPAMVPESVLAGDITEMGQFANAARLFAGALPRLIQTLATTNMALVFVNQLRSNIQTDAYKARFEPKEKSFGGYALRYYSSLRIQLKQKDQKAFTRKIPHPTTVGKDYELPVASQHSATVIKSKVSSPYQTIDYYIRFDPVADVWGQDNLLTRIEIASAKNLIEKRGGGYWEFTASDGNRIKVQGTDAVYDWYRERPDEIVHLRNLVGL